MTSKMKKTNPHKQDYLRNVYKTAAMMVVDTGLCLPRGQA